MKLRLFGTLACLGLIACDTPAGPEKTAEAVPAAEAPAQAAEVQAAPVKQAPAQQAPAQQAPSADPFAAPADVAAPPADALKTDSGLASKIITPGTGTQRPTAENTVKVHYSGWLTNGEMFDSSIRRGQPATFPLGRVIAGWTEGVQLMVVGEKRRFWIPENLAYQGRPGAPAGMLVFDVELLEIQ